MGRQASLCKVIISMRIHLHNSNSNSSSKCSSLLVKCKLSNLFNTLTHSLNLLCLEYPTIINRCLSKQLGCTCNLVSNLSLFNSPSIFNTFNLR